MARTQSAHGVRLAATADIAVPDFDVLVPGGGSLDLRETSLESVYFDTDDHALMTSGVTLWRQHGDEDEGWRLTVPAGDDRSEYRLPLSDELVPDEAVPVEFVALTTAFRRGDELRHRVRIRTNRSVQEIGDAEGATLLEIADDDVHATVPVPGGVRVEQWREFEVVQGPAGGPEHVEAVRTLLLDAGAGRTVSADRVARALGVEPGRRQLTTGSDRTAGDVITRYLRDQDQALIEGDFALRRGEQAIHPTRVATRRLRSVLKLFGDYFDAGQAARFDSEIAWYASVLGDVRDREVQRLRMSQAMSDLAAEYGQTVVGSAAKGVDRAIAVEQRAANRVLNRTLDSVRYAALIRMSGEWADRAPLTGAATAAPEILLEVIEKSRRRVRKHLAAGLGADDPEELHKARKGGKRARYAAELAAPILGAKRADKLVARYRGIQDVLGEFQDSVVAADLLRRLGVPDDDQPAAQAFTLGILWAGEQQRAKKARRRARRLIS